MKLDYFIGENIKKDYFRSDLVEKLSQTGEGLSSAHGKLTVYLPPKLGFCHGVVRAIRMAMYTAEKYPDRRIFLLNEMIHNPFVNRQLLEHGIGFLEGVYSKGSAGLKSLTPDDIVIVPAFGSTPSVYDELTKIGCTVVDTTCGEVLSVWKRVQKYNEVDYTTLVFGKYAHEETIATASRSRRYLVMKDLAETRMVADAIRNPSPAAEQALMEYFRRASSPDFHPEKDLQRVGMASQTTMYASEFIQASGLIRKAMLDRFGEDALKDHFLELDTICSATQSRQDAIQILLPYVELMIVVGGYNSSNTTSLARIASQRVPTYHVDGSGKISSERLLHQPVGSKNEVSQANWLPERAHLEIGMTSGASTPDSVLEQVIAEVLALDGGPAENSK
jgi:4-hydroxy-3-methylbut-2-enyl diphosphate reductase